MKKTLLKSLQVFLMVSVLMFSIMLPSASATELREVPTPQFQLASATTTAQTQKKVYAPWEKIVVEFSGFPGTNDWISVAPVGNSDSNYKQFLFTRHKNSGTLTFRGLPAGKYEARGYFNWPRERYRYRRTTYPFTVGVASSGSGSSTVTAKTQKKTYAPNEPIVVEFSGFPGTNDWVSVAPAANADSDYTQFLYTRHKNSGTLTFKGIPVVGNYEARGYLNWPRERYTNRQSTYAFTIAPDCVNCSAGTEQKGQIVLPATLEAGKMIVNPFNQEATLKISSTGQWNFRTQGFTLGDGDGYAKGSCANVNCQAPSLVPGTLITLDLNTKSLLGHGKAHNVKLKPNQKVIVLMNDELRYTGYRNNSGSLTVSYEIQK